MKKLLKILLVIPFILSGMTSVHAETLTTEIPVEVINGGTVIIEGERNLPEVTEIKDKGMFVINFDDPQPGDVYEYTIRQIQGNNQSVIYDEKVYTCHVYILYLNGHLSATTVINLGNEEEKPDEAIFINNSVNPCYVDPPVYKVIKGDGAPNAQFTFEMKAISNTAGYPIQSMPMPEGSVNGELRHTLQGAGAFEFGRIEYNAPGVYEYSVKEIRGDINGFTYDSSLYTAIFTVTRQGNDLVVNHVYRKNNVNVEKIEFINEYKAPVKPTPTPSTPTQKIVNNARQFIQTGVGKGVIASLGIMTISVLALLILKKGDKR